MNNIIDMNTAEQVNNELTRDNILKEVLPRFLSKVRAEALDAKEAVIRHYLELPLSVYMPMAALSNDTRNASLVLTRALLAQFDISEEEVFASAITNMEAQAQVRSFASVIMGLMPMIGEDLPVPEEPNVLYVSNENQFFGAAAILCPSVVKNIQDRMGGDFLVLPSSVHEVLIWGLNECTSDPQEIAEMVREINMSCVDPAEQLSDDVFICRDGVLSKCA